MNLFRKWLQGSGAVHRTPRARRKATRLLGPRPRLEKLEDRCLLTGNLPWPVTLPAGQSPALYDTYGQFVGPELGGMHFHEGIDIIAAPDTPVTAVENGVIRFAPFIDPANPANRWVVELSGTHGWNYVHVTPGINRRTGLTWAAGDQVNAGDQLGVVAAFPAGTPFPNHLHLDYTSNAVDALTGNILTPAGNPLDYLQALVDTTAPTLSADKIHFRLAADEAAAAPRYFTDTVAGRILVGAQAQVSAANGGVTGGSANIDITADIYDQLQPGGNRLGVYSVWFSLTGLTWGDQSGNINPFRFSRAFLAGQNYTALRNVGLVRTVYATDPFSQSASDKDFWYTLTNSPVTAGMANQPPVNVADRNLYWHSDVAAGNQWNATGAASAANNAGAAFRDDFYTLDVWSYDANGKKGETQTTVLLDNFVRTVSTSAPEYNNTDPIVVSTGTQYTANEQVPLYVLTAPPTEGQALGQGAAVFQATATADASGVLQMTDLDSARDRGLADGTYWIVADYLRDGTYHAKLDAFTTIQVATNTTGAPTVTGVNPNQGNSAGGTVVTVTGTGFTGATGVQFGGRPATNVTVVSDTQITATAPAGQPGTSVDVTVTTPRGPSATNSADRFTYQNAAPAVRRVTPDTGQGGTIVAITGTGFTGATRVQFGISPATGFTVNSDTEIIATVPAGQAGAMVHVRVITPWGTSPEVAADRFTYATSAPTVTRVTPNQGTRFGGTVVTITGTGFTGATDVRFGTNAATSFTVNLDTEIIATVPPGTGTVDVRVTSPGGTSAVVAADRFTYQNTPAVTFVSPGGGLPAGGNVVTVTGSNFVAGAAVMFGAVAVPAADVTFVNATTLRVKVPALPAGTAPPATVDVTVTTPAGTSPVSPADRYTYAAAPTVTGVAPNQGPTVGGNTITITGTNFTGATAVRFGAVPVPRDATFTVDSPTQITVTVPPQAAGVVDITVTTPSGTSAVVAADRYTYAAAAGALKLDRLNNHTAATVAYNDGAGHSGKIKTVLAQFTMTYTGGTGTPLTFNTFCIDLFHTVSLGQTYAVAARGDLGSAFLSGSRMAYIFLTFGEFDLTGDPDEAAAVQLALWDLSLNNHDPTAFVRDADGTYSSGDEDVFSVLLGNGPHAAHIAALVDQYLKASLGATDQGGWLDASPAGTAHNRGQSVLLPG
jgi:hypothetical protein